MRSAYLILFLSESLICTSIILKEKTKKEITKNSRTDKQIISNRECIQNLKKVRAIAAV